MNQTIIKNRLIVLTVVLLHLFISTSVSFAEVTSSKDSKSNLTWRDYPIPKLPFFSYSGNVASLPEKKLKTTENLSILLERIVSDDMFFFDYNGSKYNLWSALVKYEGGFETDSIPNIPSKLSNNFTYIEANYGKAYHKSQFIFSDGKTTNVYWYANICFIVDDNYEIVALCGWPSRIGTQRPVAINPLPAYDWAVNAGSNVVKIINHRPYGVLVGVRTKDALNNVLGFDGHIAAGSNGSFNLPPGKYDLFISYDIDSKSLFKGDSFELNTKTELYSSEVTEVHITLTEKRDGTYSIQRIK